jgi:hypothetical protein
MQQLNSSAAALWMPADYVCFFVLAGTHASPLPKKRNVLQLFINKSTQMIQDQFSGTNHSNW